MIFRLRKKSSPWKGLVGGLAGGLIGTIAMTQFQNAWTKAQQKMEKRKEQNQNGDSSGQSEVYVKTESEDSTMKIAGKLAGLAGYQLSREQKKKASPFVHYGFGTMMGGLYGLSMETRELSRQNPALMGAGLGTSLFVVADEIAVPAFGLSGQSSSIGAHLYSLASHMIYGMTAEGVRRLTRSVL